MDGSGSRPAADKIVAVKSILRVNSSLVVPMNSGDMRGSLMINGTRMLSWCGYLHRAERISEMRTSKVCQFCVIW